ncbi:right-handed parallel beta-helix repeat-containing protein [bacterium]|nr:right-handed parallel beta-helix repeat-containing protein [bacterium]
MKKICFAVFAMGMFLTCFAQTRISGGNLTGILPVSGSPYYVDGNIHIPTDSFLVIEPGCSLVFIDTAGFYIDSNAVLRAIGTETDSIYFTSQDTATGWEGIRFICSAEGCTLSYCRIEYSDYIGIWCYRSSPVISKSTIINNKRVGGIRCEGGSPIIVGNTIASNSAYWEGGGIYCWYSSSIVVNNVIIDNYADWGGGIYCDISSPVIVNNTIVNNRAGSGGGIFCCEGTFAIILNTILYDNCAISSGHEIRIYYEYWSDYDYPSTVFVAYTDIDTTKCYVDSGSTIIWRAGIINTNPLFASYDTIGRIDFHLTDSSRCVDAGAESIIVALRDTIIYAPTRDIDGDIRPWGTGFDIGADEYVSTGAVKNFQRPEKIGIFAYPNPFNSSCVITVSVSANVTIYDLRGNVVAVFSGNDKGIGVEKRKFVWYPDKAVSSGLYFVQANTKDGWKVTKRIVYLK